RPLSIEAMAEDIAAMIKQIGLVKPDIMGYSMGGGVALQVIFHHPELVRKAVIVSIPFRRNGFYPDILAQQAQVGPGAAEMMKQLPMYQTYASMNPKPDN